jgi:phosphopantetheine--protein transferase-like protein
VFAEKPVGVDIEKFVKHSRETLLAMGEKVFSSKEMLILENAANVRECFTKMWVIKEAFVKAVGNGLAYSSGIDLSAAMEKIVNSMGAATAIDGYKCFIERIFDDYFLSVTVKL